MFLLWGIWHPPILPIFSLLGRRNPPSSTRTLERNSKEARTKLEPKPPLPYILFPLVTITPPHLTDPQEKEGPGRVPYRVSRIAVAYVLRRQYPHSSPLRRASGWRRSRRCIRRCRCVGCEESTPRDSHLCDDQGQYRGATRADRGTGKSSSGAGNVAEHR